jgi:AcrR family transcriptional regulator
MSSPPRAPRVPKTRPGPEGGPRDQNRRRRVKEVCEAALGLFLERGLGEVTIDDIVGAAGWAKGSFYRYFRDKEELVETLLQPLGEVFRAAAVMLAHAPPQQYTAAYLQMAMTLANAVFAQPDVVRFYLQESRGPAVGARRPVRQLADEIADRAVALGAIARQTGMYRELDSRVVTLAIIGAAERLLHEHLGRKPFDNPAEVALALVSIVEEGLRPRQVSQ